MEMLLRHTSISDLATVYRRNAEQSCAPYLADSDAVRRAKDLAVKNGIWERLNELVSKQDIPVLKRSVFMEFERNGRRTAYEKLMSARSSELQRAALALWLDHPNADVDYLQDLIWACCEETTWVMPAHMRHHSIDLAATRMGLKLAEIVHVLGDRIEQEVKTRVVEEIENRVFREYWDYGRLPGWKTCENNWNHVCNSNLIRTALYLMDDPTTLANMTHTAIQSMTYALDGFEDDGGCREGLAYWIYGFGSYLNAAYALYLKTNGEVNIMADPMVKRICRYPIAVHVDGKYSSSFSDHEHGFFPSLTAFIVNEFFDMPELYELCEPHADGTLKTGGMHGLTLYRGQKVTGQPDNRDYLLPDLGEVKLRGAPGDAQITLAAQAGKNDRPHNHNDIGSFMLYRKGTFLLTDPGAPVYSRRTFSAERYESVFCNSYGHSVPLINGVQQKEGGQYRGVLRVENLNGKGIKRATIEMADAYPEGTVKKLTRVFEMDTDVNSVVLEDVFVFEKPPGELEEAFITMEDCVTVSEEGKAVSIGPEDNRLTLLSTTPGCFSVNRLEESIAESRTGQAITRIKFVPEALGGKICLRFEMK